MRNSNDTLQLLSWSTTEDVGSQQQHFVFVTCQKPCSSNGPLSHLVLNIYLGTGCFCCKLGFPAKMTNPKYSVQNSSSLLSMPL
ncbi:hypothetical protein I79_023157 [Cricetulus griseus]|uniref:Uncharacterized protein n=1 Tax=Cricetulus griseus TaxID=10029 RepID=G3IH73_CRIGR|nr:hypothetical protein I79_023157 [Cricetulus griseus]